MTEEAPWNKLAGAAYRASQRGDWRQAAELGHAAREAWLNHCDAVNGQQAARSNAEDRRKAVEDWDYERYFGRGR